MIGGVLVSIFGFRNLRKVTLMIALLVGMGLGQLWVGFSTTLLLLSCGMFFTELMIAPLNTASFTLWQSLTPPHMLARAMSVRRFLAQSAFPLGTVLAGWIAAVVEPWIVVAFAGALLVLVCLGQFRMKGFATLEDRMRLEAARPD